MNAPFDAQTYADQFATLAFPCNQFGLQEPAHNDEILNGLQYVRPGKGYKPNFPVFAKIEVNGVNEHPLYTFLKRACEPPDTKIGNKVDLFWNPIRTNDISWNFEKFVIDQNGKPRYRFHPSTEPEDVYPYINVLVSEGTNENKNPQDMEDQLSKLMEG